MSLVLPAARGREGRDHDDRNDLQDDHASPSLNTNHPHMTRTLRNSERGGPCQAPGSLRYVCCARRLALPAVANLLRLHTPLRVRHIGRTPRWRRLCALVPAGAPPPLRFARPHTPPHPTPEGLFICLPLTIDMFALEGF
jgi:hypothetical protein